MNQTVKEMVSKSITVASDDNVYYVFLAMNICTADLKNCENHTIVLHLRINSIQLPSFFYQKGMLCVIKMNWNCETSDDNVLWNVSKKQTQYIPW